ncbi:J domain-containing protein [Thermosynechococcaceae cyanobacterium Okahandja]
MNHYYDILGLPSGASHAEVQDAYRRLCLECHPDQLPPNTPKRARQIVEEHFKQINEAYAALMEYSSVYSSSGNSYKPPDASLQSIFDPARMEAIRSELEAEREVIEQQYQQKLEHIHDQQQQKLIRHGLTRDDLEKLDFTTKSLIAVFLIILSLPSLAGLALGGIFMFPSIGWFILCGILLLSVLGAKTVDSITYEVISEIKKATTVAKTRADEQRQQRLRQQEAPIRQRVDYFKSLPLATLSNSFAQRLSDRDRFFLLLAIKEREDAEHILRNLPMNVKIAAGIV